jgi:hypothetical protein
MFAFNFMLIRTVNVVTRTRNPVLGIVIRLLFSLKCSMQRSPIWLFSLVIS